MIIFASENITDFRKIYNYIRLKLLKHSKIVGTSPDATLGLFLCLPTSLENVKRSK